MVVDELTGKAAEIIANLGSLALWLQTLGVLLIAWIIFEVIMVSVALKRMKEIYKIKEDMKRIEGKIDRVLKGISKK